MNFAITDDQQRIREAIQRICARFKNEGPQLYAHMLAQLTRDEET